MKGNIQRVIDEDLCVGCGTCYSTCPLEAITLTKKDVFVPSIITEKCNYCGLCVLTCPGYHVDYKLFQSERDEKVGYNSYIGKYVNVYLGHATNQHIRFMGSSGGVITALLAYALENGIIDGALVVTLKKMDPVVFIAKSPKEVQEAMGSKYIPVPLNVGLREILNTDGHFAVVGLPCHLLGLSRIISVYPVLAKKIVLRLGLFCGRGFDYHFVNYVLNGLGVSSSRMRKIRFRGYGWPGKVCVNYVLGSGSKELFMDYKELGKYSGGYLFMPKRCFFCPDHTAELADISFGDAWLDRIKRLDSQGTSLIIARTHQGNKILLAATQTGVINVSKSSAKTVLYSQYPALNFHKFSFATRHPVAKILGVKTPLINVETFYKKSIFMKFFSASLIMTQVAYGILKKLGIPERLPKLVVMIWGLFHTLLGITGFKLAMRGKVDRKMT